MRGLGNRVKRTCVFNYFRDKQLDIIFMQEVHCKRNTSIIWQQEWGSNWYTASGDNQSRGTVIMINPRSNVEVTKFVCDHDGHQVLLNIKKYEQEYTLCNIYAPNQDDPSFFMSVFKSIVKFGKENIILDGDFNLVMKPDIDRLNSMINHHKSSSLIGSYMDKFSLTDIWHDRNPLEKIYTWHRCHNHNGPSASRINMFLINQGLSDGVSDVKIHAGCCTDHSMIEMTIVNNECKRGPGVWRINNSMLNNDEYCDLITGELITRLSSSQGCES